MGGEAENNAGHFFCRLAMIPLVACTLFSMIPLLQLLLLHSRLEDVLMSNGSLSFM